jgi:translation initiation factor IF-3
LVIDDDGLTDYGKVRFEQERADKAEDRRTREREVPTKEIQLLVGIADRDFNMKVEQARRLLASPADLRVSVREFEPSQAALAEALLRRFLIVVEDAAMGVSPQPRRDRERAAVVWSL